MSGPLPRPIPAGAEAAILRLNNAHATTLSWLDGARLAAMLAGAFHARRIGEADAFLLAFDETAAYDSVNYAWFRARYRRFVYVDRLAVAPAVRARGLARLLYADLLAHAAAAGHDLVGCEVNRDPPNPASDALHAALGFQAVGAAALPDGAKTVRYLLRRV